MIFHTYAILPDELFDITRDNVFVFGSNLAGRHGAGAAKTALKYGAKMGVGVSQCGCTYAIPTKDKSLTTLPLEEIRHYVDKFKVAAEHSSLTFYLTEVGCGLAGYSAKDIAPMFKGSPVNCIFPIAWREYLET